MREIEIKLRGGMTKKGIPSKTQDEIVQSIASFALYGFPEAHAASFALLAYASAYLKCHYLAAFTAATLNNQPMGFYQPFTIIKDAQRHGLKVKPVDVTRSNWECTLEEGVGDRVLGVGSVDDGSDLAPFRESSFHILIHPSVNDAVSREGAKTQSHAKLSHLQSGNPLHAKPYTLHPALRLGLLCVKGLREEAGQAIVRARSERPFSSLDDLHRRVPELRKDELRKLATVGALNFIKQGVGVSGEGADRKSDFAFNSSAPELNRHPKLETLNRNLLPPKPHSLSPDVHRRDALWQVHALSARPGTL